MTGLVEPASVAAFAESRELFETVLGWLEGREAGGMEHSQLEAQLQADARELFGQMFQDHLDLRAQREQRIEDVIDADQVAHPRAEPGHTRGLATVFGQVRVTRIAYRARGRANLHPADGVLNLPQEEYSHGLRRLAAVEASRGSYDGAVEAIERGTGQQVGKRQVEQLARRSASDVEGFYRGRQPPAGSSSDPLVLSCDGKGVVMRSDALRPATAAAAAKTRPKLATRLSKGEKRNRKRMAEVGTVFDATAAPRTVRGHPARERDRTRPGRPRTSNHEQVADRQRRRPDLRRGRPPRPGPRPHLGGTGRRQQPPDRPDRRRGERPKGAGDHRDRLYPRPRVHLEGGLVLPP